MISGASQTTELQIYSQNLNGLTQDKEDGLHELMDKLQLDVIFLSETFRASPENSTSQIDFRSRACFCTSDMTNANRRRGIQFRVRSHLDALVTPILCFKDSHVEILSITIPGLLIMGVYAPDGKLTEGTFSRSWTEP